ncbi:MAG: preprotein translocase subunit YajC [Chloroflexota bacterium]|nr:preprotein translocase subunit YajC [Dehalococcoidia bacterium]MDW8252978.1 preprotein translocase subunit YajC [Chloroflexota bacterium]
MDPASIVLLILLGVWMLALFVGLPYLQARRQRRLIRELSHGDPVIILNGVLGKVHRVDAGIIEVEIAPKTRVRCLPSAISRTSRT